MNPLLSAIADGWGWKLGKPVAVVATNPFGNAIVKNDDGKFFRIIPEDLQCELLANSVAELEEKRKERDFIHDWEMTAMVVRAEAALGPLSEGEVYYLVVASVLGGKYSEENIRKISLLELFGFSGDVAEQVEGVPPGSRVIFVPMEKEPNHSTEPTPTSGTSAAEHPPRQP